MRNEWIFEVEGTPQPKERARQGQTGRGGKAKGKAHFFPATATVDYESKIAGAAMEAGLRWAGLPFRVEVSVYVPDRIARDGDNILKSVLDGLQKAGPGALPGDDLFRVPEKEIRLGGIDRARPRIVVRIRELEAFEEETR